MQVEYTRCSVWTNMPDPIIATPIDILCVCVHLAWKNALTILLKQLGVAGIPIHVIVDESSVPSKGNLMMLPNSKLDSMDE